MSYDFSRVRVVLAEDINMMQDLMSYALDCLGVKHILKASDGKAAYDLCVQQNPDVVICDWQMQPVDGLSLVKKIRQDEGASTRTVPIIMVTGYASEEYVAAARDAGVNEFLVKPFTAESLANRLSAIVERPRSYVEAPHYFGPDRRRKSMKVAYKGPKRRDEDMGDDQWSVDI
ncbi:MAG: response regulator [Alphaproteobacteria bacterium]|nr:response regulator [Alphaproteobacteria bacterium]